MKCPHCGAELQENARFCLYCMEPLEEPTELPAAKAHKKRRLLWLLVPTLACIGIVLLFLHPGAKPTAMGDATAPTEAPPTSLPATEAETTPPTAQEPITNANAFWSDALTESDADTAQLWSPASLYLLEETATMQCYAVPLHVPAAGYSVYFLDGGASVLAAITGLTDETLSDGEALAETTIRTIYRTTGYDAPSLADAPAPQEAAASWLETLQLTDPVAGAKITALERTDLDSTIPTGLGLSPLNVSYERRTRNENNITYYDIFIYFYTD